MNKTEKRFDIFGIALLMLSFLLGVYVTSFAKMYPTEPTDWFCEDHITGIEVGYKLCKIKE